MPSTLLLFLSTLSFCSTDVDIFYDQKVNIITEEGEILQGSKFWHDTQRYIYWFQDFWSA